MTDMDNMHELEASRKDLEAEVRHLEYKHGYLKAIDDVCTYFDRVYTEYQRIYKDDSYKDDAVCAVEHSLLAINSVIVDLSLKAAKL